MFLLVSLIKHGRVSSCQVHSCKDRRFQKQQRQGWNELNVKQQTLKHCFGEMNVKQYDSTLKLPGRGIIGRILHVHCTGVLIFYDVKACEFTHTNQQGLYSPFFSALSACPMHKYCNNERWNVRGSQKVFGPGADQSAIFNPSPSPCWPIPQ